jgi:hypothetical protein
VMGVPLYSAVGTPKRASLNATILPPLSIKI